MINSGIETNVILVTKHDEQIFRLISWIDVHDLHIIEFRLEY